jgi:hypothetical protein
MIDFLADLGIEVDRSAFRNHFLQENPLANFIIEFSILDFGLSLDLLSLEFTLVCCMESFQDTWFLKNSYVASRITSIFSCGIRSTILSFTQVLQFKSGLRRNHGFGRGFRTQQMLDYAILFRTAKLQFHFVIFAKTDHLK